jgi:hypothetical protein
MKKVMRKMIQGILLALLVLLWVPSRLNTAPPNNPAVDWVRGDVFVAVGNGNYQVWHSANPAATTPTYSQVQTIPDGLGGTTAGCAFDSGYRFFGTNFSNTRVDRYSIDLDNGLVQSITTGTGSPLSQPPVPVTSTHPESIVFRGGAESFFVGHADNGSGVLGSGSGTIEQWILDPSTGNFGVLNGSARTANNTYLVNTENRGADWIDLASNNTTIFYTSEGRLIKRFDTVSGQLTDFANLGNGGGSQVTLFALKILPPGYPFAGDVLVADKKNIKLVNSSSTVIRTYDAPGQDDWEALSLDPNGSSFWAGDATTHNFYRFNIGTIETGGTIEVGPINTGAGLDGICVDGAFSAAQPTSTIFPPVTLTPGPDHTATASFTTSSGTIWTATLVNIANNANITLTARESLVHPSVALSDPFIFQQSPGNPFSTTPITGNLACDQTFTPGSCEVFEIEANPNSGYGFADYEVSGPQIDHTPNLRLLRNHDQDITTSVLNYPLSGTKTKCVLTINQTPTSGAISCGFSSPVSGQVFNQGKSIPFKFQAAPSQTACQSNGPFLTNLQPLLLIVQLPPTATPPLLTPAPLPITVQVAGGSGGPPIFTLGGTGSTGNNTTYQLQVKTTNMSVGNYRATVIDLNNVIPSFGVDFTLQ